MKTVSLLLLIPLLLVGGGYQAANAQNASGQQPAESKSEKSAEVRAAALLDRGATRMGSRYGAEDRSEAIADFSEVITMPDAPGEYRAAAFCNRGAAKHRSGDLFGARADYQEALKVSRITQSTRGVVYYNLGCLESLAGNVDAALNELSKANKDQFHFAITAQHLDEEKDFDRIRKNPKFLAFRASLPANQQALVKVLQESQIKAKREREAAILRQPNANDGFRLGGNWDAIYAGAETPEARQRVLEVYADYQKSLLDSHKAFMKGMNDMLDRAR